MARRRNNKQAKKAPASKQKKETTQKGGSIANLVVQGIKAAAPLLLKGAMMAATGIPFPTSGARAIASPSPQSVTQLSAPSANGAMVKTSKANMRSTAQGTTISHREFITDVVTDGTGAFELLEFEDVNPSNPNLFPWLSGIAPRYEKFLFDSLKFIYEPQTGTNQVGTVMLAVDYDANDTPPIDKTQMMSYKGAVRSPTWFAAVNESTVADLHTQKNFFVNSGNVGDDRLNSTGKFILAMQSDNGSVPFTAGELYIEYTVRLMTPQLDVTSPSATISFEPVTIDAALGVGNVDLGDSTVVGSLPVTTIPHPSDTTTDIIFGAVGTYMVAQTFGPVDSFPNGAGNVTSGAIVPAESDVEISTVLQGLLQQTAAAPDGYSTATIYFVRVKTPGSFVRFGFGTEIAVTGSFTSLFRIFITPIEDRAIVELLSDPLLSRGMLLRHRAIRLRDKNLRTLRLRGEQARLKSLLTDADSDIPLRMASDRIPVGETTKKVSSTSRIDALSDRSDGPKPVKRSV